MRKIIIMTLVFFSFLLFLKYFVFAPSSVDKLYYISNAKIYVKLHREATSDTVNIYLTRNKYAHFFGREDCIKINQNFPITLILDGSNFKKIRIPSYCRDGIGEIYSNEFEIECSKDEYTDTLFYKPMQVDGIHILKKTFFGIAISEYVESTFITLPGDSTLTKINEIVR